MPCKANQDSFAQMKLVMDTGHRLVDCFRYRRDDFIPAMEAFFRPLMNKSTTAPGRAEMFATLWDWAEPANQLNISAKLAFKTMDMDRYGELCKESAAASHNFYLYFNSIADSCEPRIEPYKLADRLTRLCAAIIQGGIPSYGPPASTAIITANRPRKRPLKSPA